MNKKTEKLMKFLIYCMTLHYMSGPTLANPNNRANQDFWSTKPELLENTGGSEEIPVMDDYDDHEDQQSNGETAIDIELLAKESGISYSQAETAINAQDAFARYADKLLVRFPDRISRIWKEPTPSTKSYIQFVGEIPDSILDDIWKNKVPKGLTIEGGATISFNDQVKRAQIAARSLRKAGYVNSSTFYNPIKNVIQLDIKLPKLARNPDPKQILSAIQDELRGTDLRDHLLTLTEKDLHIKTIRGDGPIMEFDHARGGNWLKNNGSRWCTSGWSVNGPNGDGIITAGHCSGADKFEEEGGVIFDITERDVVFGAGGDIAYYTAPNHIELDDFYAREGEIRDVSGIRSTITMLGSSVCEYGRSSNTRTCNHGVEALFVTVNFSSGTVNNLVRVSGDNSIGGDSGGGWSFGNTAWGVHSGSNGVQSFFTPAQLAEFSLNVTIKR